MTASTSKPSPRNTRQKQAIRSAFEEADRPLSPEEALVTAQRHYKNLGIATVYRNIKQMLADGSLEPVSLPGEAMRYEIAGKAHHHHFHCQDCGKLYELEGCSTTMLPRLPRGFRVTGHEFLLYGVCARCASGRAATHV